MTTKNQISSKQLYTVFFLCRLLGLFTFIAPQKYPLSAGDSLILFLPFAGFELLVYIPVFMVTKQQKTLPTLIKEISPAASKGIGVLAFLGLCYTAGLGISRLHLFMNTTLYTRHNLTLYTVLLIAGAFFVAQKGLEAIARSSGIVLFFIVLILCGLVVLTAEDFTLYNTDLPLKNGWFPLLQNGFAAAARTTEPLCLLFLCDRVNSNTKKGFPIFVILFCVFSSFMLFYIAGVTGLFGESQIFKLYTLTVLAKIGNFERLDDLTVCLWILCTLLRTALYLFTAKKAVEDAFETKNRIPAILAPIAVFLFCLPFIRSSLLLANTVNSVLNRSIFVLWAVLIPLTVLLFQKLSAKKKKGGTLA